MIRTTLAISFTLATCLCACTRADDASRGAEANHEFSGTWVAVIHGEKRPLLQIRYDKGQYRLARTDKGRWTDTDNVAMEPLTQQDFERYVGHPVSVHVTGVRYEAAGIVKLPIGFTEGSFVSHTGYLLVTAAGPVEVEKL